MFRKLYENRRYLDLLVHVAMVHLQVVEHVCCVSVFGLHSLATEFADGETVEHDRPFCVLQEAEIFPNSIGVLCRRMKLRELRGVFVPLVLQSFLKEFNCTLISAL